MPPGRPKGKQPEGANVGDQQSPALQLRELLLLENNIPIFEEIRNNIRLIAKEFLDINETPHKQTKALQAITKELIDRYPDLFDAEDKERRLDLAIRMVRSQHNNLRCLKKNKQKNMATKNDKSRRTSRRLSARPGASSTKQVKAEPKAPVRLNVEQRPASGYRDYIVPTNFTEPSSSSQPESQGPVNPRPPATPLRPLATPGISISALPPHVITPQIPGSSLSTNTAATTTPNVSRTGPNTVPNVPNTPNFPRTPNVPRTPGVESALPDREEVNEPWKPQPRLQSSRCGTPFPRVNRGNEFEDTDAIFNFLASCVPSMGHLFEGFVNYGCNNEEFLFGISSWPPVLITEFIRKVATKCGEYVSDMEVDVLQARFLTYFNVLDEARPQLT